MQSIGQVVGSNPFKRDSNRAVVNGVPGARQSREAARPQAGNPVSRIKSPASLAEAGFLLPVLQTNEILLDFTEQARYTVVVM